MFRLQNSMLPQSVKKILDLVVLWAPRESRALESVSYEMLWILYTRSTTLSSAGKTFFFFFYFPKEKGLQTDGIQISLDVTSGPYSAGDKTPRHGVTAPHFTQSNSIPREYLNAQGI